MSGENSAYPAKQCNACRSHFESCEKLGEPKAYLAIKIQIEKSFDLTRLISRFATEGISAIYSLMKIRSCAKDSGILQRRRNQRVRENIQRFVQIRACMVRGHTGAETNAVLSGTAG